MRAYIFTFLVVAASASILEELGTHFQAYKVNHKKVYQNQAEENARFNIFKENVRKIEEHNALYEQGFVSYKKGINQFTDMTHEERLATLTLRHSLKSIVNASTLHANSRLEIPKSVDWKKAGQVCKVKTQGQCGGCWSFSITGAVEGAYARKTGVRQTFSEQQLIDCTIGINGGCNGGYVIQTLPYVQSNGLMIEKNYPFTGVNGNCRYDASKVKTRISSFYGIRTGDEHGLLDAVGNIGPVSVSIDADYIFDYHSGVFEDKRCTLNLNHAVLATGYGSENGKPYWIIKNSWGEEWGNKGYFKLARGKNHCGVAQDGSYPQI